MTFRFDVYDGLKLDENRRGVNIKFPFSDMRVGHCLLAPGVSCRLMRAHIYYWQQNTPEGKNAKMVVRTSWMKEDKRGHLAPCEKSYKKAIKGVKVWRVK
jgi:hypothetical protein